MNISVILPLHNPDKGILDKIINKLKKQRFNGKIEIIKVDNGLGLAASINYGIKKAKNDIIVTLHQDCIPEDKNWLQKLLEPLKKKDFVASVSDVELPFEIWNKFGLFTKALTLKEFGVLTPLLDGKACAFKKNVLKEIGLFNERYFHTAGEDFDLYIKLLKKGKIDYPHCKVFHIHKTNFENRLKKELQYANAFGALVKIHGKNLPSWKKGIIKSIPILGVIPLFKFPFQKSIKLFFPYVILIPVIHFTYVFGFWRGFIEKKQTI